MSSTRLCNPFGCIIRICCVFIVVLSAIVHNTCSVMHDSQPSGNQLLTYIFAVHLNSLSYTSNQLKQLRVNAVSLPAPSVRHAIRQLCLARVVRGCRAGARVQARRGRSSTTESTNSPAEVKPEREPREIPVIISHTRPHSSKQRDPSDGNPNVSRFQNLIKVKLERWQLPRL